MSTQAAKSQTTLQFAALKEKIFAYRPILGEILSRYGKISLYEYAAQYQAVSENSKGSNRKAEFIETFHQETEKRLGPEIAKSAAKQLSIHYTISTADHHGPLCHPFFLSSNLITAATLAGSNNPSLRHVIVLACANISFNNSSYPRGLLITSAGTSPKTPIPLPFFPDSIRAHSVIHYPGFSEKEMRLIPNKIDRLVSEKHLTTHQGRQLKSLISEVYQSPDVMNCSTYSDQITKTNDALWKKFFSPQPMQYPSVIYLESEMLVTQLLVQHHISSDTVIHRILFDPMYQKLLIEKFDTIMGGFSLAQKLGTYLFWALPPDRKYKQQLWKEGDDLITSDGHFRVELTPRGITTAINKRELIPSTLLVFLVLSCYYGLKLLGGFNQVNYLTQIKKAYLSMLNEVGDQESAAISADTITDKLCGDFITAFIKTHDGTLAPATGLDLILRGTPDTWRILVETSHTITLEEALSPMMPEMYRIIYPENEQDLLLTKLTKEDITTSIGLDKKINACVEIT